MRSSPTYGLETGQDGPIPWLPQSPDLTVLDLFFCICILNIFRNVVVEITDMKDKRKLTISIDTHTLELHHSTWTEIDDHFDVC